MSKYVEFGDIQFKDEECLVKALLALGFTEAQIDRKATALKVYWQSYGQTAAACNIRIERSAFSGLDDLGFRRTDKGLVPIIGTHDHRNLAVFAKGDDFVRKLTAAYGEQVGIALAKKLRGRFINQGVQGSVVRMQVRY